MDAKSKREVVKKADLYDSTKDRIKARIESNIKTAIEKLEQTEKELLNDVEIEFGQNPFSEFLANENPTPAEVNGILSQVIPINFGPDEESFHPLFREIEALKAWRGDPSSGFDLTPKNVSVENVSVDSITLMWEDDWRAAFYQIEVDGSKILERTTTNTFTKRGLLPGSEHKFRVRSVRGSSVSKWSDAVRGWTKWECIWRKCSDIVDESRKYSVDEENPRIVTKFGADYYSTIIGNIPLPLYIVTLWNIKILKSRDNGGGAICIGVSPSDINQNEERNFDKCGWYFWCYDSTLWSGPPHNFKAKEYGPRKRNGQYVHTGDSVCVVMDTTKGDLSFVVNGVNLGVAYEGIPLDKPLVPCVILGWKENSVELDKSEVKETVVDSSIPAPSNITTKSTTCDFIIFTWDAVEGASFYQIEVDGSKPWGKTTENTFTKKGLLPNTEHTFRVRVVRGDSVSEWSDIVKRRTQKLPPPSKITVKSIAWDSITFTWDAVEGASFYQIEVDVSKFLSRSSTNTFTKIGLLPNTEHTFRVRTVRGNSVSEWSDVVKRRTQKELFETSAWKKCPDNVDKNKKYSVYKKNPRVATIIGDEDHEGWFTVIGDRPLPLNKVISWSIKILKSRKNNGYKILVGVAPSDINQNEDRNYYKCGWYFDCFWSTLFSGPPQNYKGKDYGPRKGQGKYIHTGGSVGVAMDTAKGELSFVLDGVNLGVAYKGIPLDKPLVPCVLLESKNKNDSIELVI